MRRSLVSAIIFLVIGATIAFGKAPLTAIPPTHQRPPMAVQPPVYASQTDDIEPIEVTPTPTPIPTATPIQATDSSQYRPTGGGIMGAVSYYSREGCIGCSEHLITASGEPLDDSKFTLAVSPGQFPMGQMVLVTNLNTGRQAIAKVNDTGGFAKYNRVADLSLALYEYLNAKTDESTILIEPVIK